MAAKKKPVLGTFDSKDVLSTSIKITNAGDGLSKAMAVDPQLMALHEKVYVVLECEVSRVQFQDIKDVDGVLRIHTLKAGTATVVDADMVADVLEAQVARLEEAAGVTRLPFTGDERTDEEIING
jgi:hypothetical protein